MKSGSLWWRPIVPAAIVLMLTVASCLFAVGTSDMSSATEAHWTIDSDGNLVVDGSGTLEGKSPMWAFIVTATISKGVTAIGDEAFKDCTNLTTVTVRGQLDSIGSNAFDGCSELVTVSFAGTVRTIGTDAFKGCGKLATVNFGDSVESIGDSAFEECSALTSFAAPGQIVSIGKTAFRNSGLQDISVTGGIGTVDNGAFALCYSLKTVEIGGPIGRINECAFIHCDLMTSFVVHGTVGPIGPEAFYHCSVMNTFSVRSIDGDIGSNAFRECTSLDAFTVYTAVTSIGDGAFSDSNNIKTVYVDCGNHLNIQLGTIDNGCIAMYADEIVLVHDYHADYGWSDDFKSCTIDISCMRGDVPHEFIEGDVKSTVIVEPTDTEMGMTEYTVSGTYDGFDYSDVREVQDIPAKGSPSKDDMVILEVTGAAAVIVLVVSIIVILRRK